MKPREAKSMSFFSRMRATATTTIAAVLFAALSVTAAMAAPDQCSGTDMLGEFKTTEPELYKKVMDEAAAIENTEALLWKIEKDGTPVSYLFGTVHLPDARVTNIPAAASSALQASKTLVVEVADLSDEGMIAAVAQAPELLAYLDGTTLKSQLSPEEFDKVTGIVGKMGMPAEAAVVLRPWLVSMLLAITDCQRDQMKAGKKALDARLEEIAKANGAKVVGLETAASQLASMASVPNDQQILMLRSGLAYVERTDDLVETLIQLYLSRKLGATMPFQKALAAKIGIPPTAFDGFMKILLADRNQKMVETAKPLLDKGNTFVAVGALHLPGKDGLVTLLRGAGYKVTALE